MSPGADPRAVKPRIEGLGTAWWLRVLVAVFTHPRLWGVAWAQTFRLARPGWWRRPPFLPVPDAAYVKFRLVTAYGGEGTAPSVDDVLTYLRWRKRWPTLAEG